MAEKWVDREWYRAERLEMDKALEKSRDKLARTVAIAAFLVSLVISGWLLGVIAWTSDSPKLTVLSLAFDALVAMATILVWFVALWHARKSGR